MTDFGIHWFRRDLRIAGNPGLQYNWKVNKGNVLGLFIFDSHFLSRADFSHNRFGFFLNTLNSLKNELQGLGSDLLVLDSNAIDGMKDLLLKLSLQNSHSLTTITFNRDYEPFARSRDKKITDLFKEKNIPIYNFRDHLIIEPHELLKEDGTPYKVFTPFFNKWFQHLQNQNFSERIENQKKYIYNYLNSKNECKNSKKFNLKWNDLKIEVQDHLSDYLQKNKLKLTVHLPKQGFAEAFIKITDFNQKLKSYKIDRDFPNVNGTSQVSTYLKNGSITTSQICAIMDLHKQGVQQYLKELVWREFYYHIMYHFPQNEQNSFIPKYNQIKWDNNLVYFEKWKNGLTGFPIVDAGMRQLKSTGWMHNRVRMIVASFLVKDLIIDWRWGEQYFMEQLLDGDLAPNNGGWQWCASTGCDPQPYFRIFNPESQSIKFDPEGEYIKNWIPELSQVPAKYIHNPQDYFKKFKLQSTYPEKIINHSVQRIRALQLYKNCE